MTHGQGLLERPRGEAKHLQCSYAAFCRDAKTPSGRLWGAAWRDLVIRKQTELKPEKDRAVQKDKRKELEGCFGLVGSVQGLNFGIFAREGQTG